MAHEDDDDVTLVCGALTLAKKNSIFLKRWYDAFESDDPSCLTGHAVALPEQLVNLYPNEIRVLLTEHICGTKSIKIISMR